MPEFRAKVRGSGHVMNRDGEIGTRGFIVNRFVCANDPDEAIQEALRRVRADRRLEGRRAASSGSMRSESFPPGGAPCADRQGSPSMTRTARLRTGALPDQRKGFSMAGERAELHLCSAERRERSERSRHPRAPGRQAFPSANGCRLRGRLSIT